VADTKISALGAIGTLGFDDLLAVIDDPAGTPLSKRTTLQAVRDLFGPKYIAGNSGAANPNAAPAETLQVLTADAAQNATTTYATVMTTTGLPIGTYLVEYFLRYQSTVSTTGVKFRVGYTGSVTRANFTRIGLNVLSTAVSGIMAQAVTANGGGTVNGWAGRIDDADLGPSVGVDVVNVDVCEIIRGTIVVSTSANLILEHGSETANGTTVMADTCLRLTRLA